MGKKNLAHETDKENNLEAKQARADGVYPIRVAKKKKKTQNNVNADKQNLWNLK